jgi:hypothetical protein
MMADKERDPSVYEYLFIAAGSVLAIGVIVPATYFFNIYSEYFRIVYVFRLRERNTSDNKFVICLNSNHIFK